MTYSVRNIVVALGTALAAAALVLVYTTSFKEQVTRDQQRLKVLVATVEIPAGTPAAKAAGSMELREVVAADKAPGAVTEATQLKGTVATQTVFAGQQVVRDTFEPALTQDSQFQLAKTERGVRVEVNMAKGVLGPIQPGETVDVFGTFTLDGKDGGEVDVTRLLMKDVRVLEAPDLSDEKAAAEIDTKHIVMLAVDQQQAAKLAFMGADSENRVLQLVVRPPKGQAAEMPIPLETVETMIMDGLTAAEIRQRVPQVSAAARGNRATTDEGTSPTATTGG